MLNPPQRPEGTYLGFDFGTKRIGLAVGQTLTHTANALNLIHAEEGIPKNWTELDNIIKEWRPAGLVVGLPLNMDGTQQWISEQASGFANSLVERYQLPVYTIDERLTSFEARQRLFDSGGSKAINKSQIDCLAASLILESWLNT